MLDSGYKALTAIIYTEIPLLTLQFSNNRQASAFLMVQETGSVATLLTAIALVLNSWAPVRAQNGG